MTKEKLSNIAVGVLAICALITSGLVVRREFSPPAAAPSTNPFSHFSGWQELAKEGTELYGNKNAAVTVLVFSDFQCPACNQLSTTLAKLRDAYPDRVQVIVRHFPLEALHRNAFNASLAAECANAVGKFAVMDSALFAMQDAVSQESWGVIAKAAGVADTAQLVQCVRQSEYETKVRNDIVAGNRLDVRATPTLLVNDTRITGSLSFHALDSLTKAKLLKLPNNKE